MTMRYPNQSLARHFNLHKQRMSVYGLSLHLGSSESSKIVEQKLIHLIIVFFGHRISADSVAPLSVDEPTHNPQFQGLTFKTLAFKLFTVANLGYQLVS